MLSAASVGSNPSGPSLIVANKGDEAIGIIDPHSGQQVAEVPEGGTTAHEVIASPDGRLIYAPIYGNSGVGKPGTDGHNMVVIDRAQRKVVGNVDFGRGVRPHCPQFGPKNGLLYVTTELDKTISIIDPKSLKIVGDGAHRSGAVAHAHDLEGRPPRLHRERRAGHCFRPRS